MVRVDDLGEGQETVVGALSFVFAQFHFFDTVVEFFSFFLGFDQRVFGLLFVVNMNFGEPLAGFHECTENIESRIAPTLSS
jgi:hypothetical protein